MMRKWNPLCLRRGLGEGSLSLLIQLRLRGAEPCAIVPPMTPAYRATAVFVAFRQEALSDADLEKIIASAITRAVSEEREQCAFMANVEASVMKGKSTAFEEGKRDAYADLAIQIRNRSHAR